MLFTESIVVGSKDLSARVYYRVNSKNMATSILSGHRDVLIGGYFSSDSNRIYTIAADGAVFIWEFEEKERIHIEQNINENNLTKRGSTWKLSKREFLWDPHTHVSSSGYLKAAELLVIGFDNGVFGIYDMPDCTNIHRLSVSSHSLSTVAINCTGDWLALVS